MTQVGGVLAVVDVQLATANPMTIKMSLDIWVPLRAAWVGRKRRLDFPPPPTNSANPRAQTRAHLASAARLSGSTATTPARLSLESHGIVGQAGRCAR